MQGSPAKFVLNRNTVWTRTKTAKDEVRGSGGEEEGIECVKDRAKGGEKKYQGPPM